MMMKATRTSAKARQEDVSWQQAQDIDEFECIWGKTGMFRKSLAENGKLGIRRGKWDLEAFTSPFNVDRHS